MYDDKLHLFDGNEIQDAMAAYITILEEVSDENTLAIIESYRNMLGLDGDVEVEKYLQDGLKEGTIDVEQLFA